MVVKSGIPLSTGTNIGIFTFFCFSRRLEPDIADMRGNDQNDRKREQKQLVRVPVLFGEQKEHSGGKQHKGHITAVMPDKTMAKRQDAQYESQRNHAGFKEAVVDDIDAQKGETAQKKGQHGAMDRTGDGSTDT